MRKITFFLLCIVLCVLFAGCFSNHNQADVEQKTSASETNVVETMDKEVSQPSDVQENPTAVDEAVEETEQSNQSVTIPVTEPVTAIDPTTVTEPIAVTAPTTVTEPTTVVPSNSPAVYGDNETEMDRDE